MNTRNHAVRTIIVELVDRELELQKLASHGLRFFDTENVIQTQIDDLREALSILDAKPDSQPQPSANP